MAGTAWRGPKGRSVSGRGIERAWVDGGRLLLGVLAVALAAWVSVPVPGTPVPQSLQTLAVVVIGLWLGPHRGALAMVLYIVAGAAGLPVFADGAAGLEHAVGPTLGYLVGFVGAAYLVGWRVRQVGGRTVWSVFVAALLAHALILGVGWLRLGALAGVVEAFDDGVRPFLLGGVLKSVLAAVVWVPLRRATGDDDE